MSKTTPAPNLTALLDALQSSLDAGDLAGARRRDLQLRRARGDGKLKLTQAQDRQLAAAHRRLHELRDWQHWANNKRRQRLCKKVEALPQSGLHPDALLEALHAAQTEWKHLEEQEKLPGEDKAYLASGPGLWHRFRAASNRAFNEIRPFLEKRTELRNENLKAVDALIKHLEHLAHAPGALDGPATARELRNARRVFGRLGELPPAKRGSVAKRLRPAIDRLSKRLKEHHGAIEERKRALLKEAEALSTNENLQAAIQAAKRLNRCWKQAGSLPRGRERKLWEQLRFHLDPLFERQSQLHAQREADRQAAQQTLIAMCEAAEKLAALRGEELEQRHAEFKSLQSRWRGSRVNHRDLKARFKRAEEAFQHQLAEQQSIRHFSRIRQLFEEATHLQKASDTAGKMKTGDAGAGELCLEMELIAGVDSPPEDQRARMNLKVRRLNDALRGESESQDDAAQFEATLIRWCRLARLPEGRAEQLQARVKHSIEVFYGQRL